MNAILITLNVIVLATLAALAYEWRPALFAYLIVGPFSLLSLWGISKGGVSARTIFVTTTAVDETVDLADLDQGAGQFVTWLGLRFLQGSIGSQ